MAYKRYILKNGKKIGPYLYTTKRINGKTVTQYLGKEKESGVTFNKGIKILIYSVLGIFILILASFFLLNPAFTGKPILDINESIIYGNETSNSSEVINDSTSNETVINETLLVENGTLVNEAGIDETIGNETVPIKAQTLKAIGFMSLSSNYNASAGNSTIWECGNITDAGVYTLNQSFSSTDTCIRVLADNITLDGNGFTINSTHSGNGVESTGRVNITIKNLNIRDFSYGIYFSSVNNSLIQNITANSNYRGISIFSSFNNQIINNTVKLNNYNGIQLSSSSNNQILNNILTSNSLDSGNGGIDLISSNNNTIQFNNGTSDNMGIYLSSSSLNWISDNIFSSPNQAVLYISSSNNTLLNNQLSGSSYSIKANSHSINYIIYNNSYGEIRWTNDSYDSFLDYPELTGALSFPGNIRIENNSVYLQLNTFSVKINSRANITLNGIGPRFTNPAILRNGILCGTDCTNFTSLTADTVIFQTTTWGGVGTASANFTIGESPAGNLTACGDLALANTVYTLQNNISTTTTCFFITADNITLKGNGFTINSTHSGNGVESTGRVNITIKNLNIRDFNYGIYFSSVNNSLIQNITANSNYRGISIFSSFNNQIINNTVKLNNYNGIQLSSSSNNQILNNILTSNSLDSGNGGIDLISSNNNTIQFNNGTSDNMGIYLSSSSLNWISDNIFSSPNQAVLYISSSNNTLLNNQLSGSSYSIKANSHSINYIIYNNSYGEIRWTNDSYDSFLDYPELTGALSFPGNIRIENNSVYLNITAFGSNPGINSSANITLNLAGWHFTNPRILKDGQPCGNACQNFTNLTGGKIEKFSVTSWSNYSIGESPETTPPTISFVLPTEIAGSSINRSNMIINVTAYDTESGLKNITIYFYNSAKVLINLTNSTSSPLSVNFTGLAEGIYYFNATACDNSNNCGSTETRNVTIDTLFPTINFATPTTSSGGYSQNWIVANVTANDTNLANITIRIYNSVGIIRSNYSNNPKFFWNITLLGDGTYYLNATACDNALNCNSTETRTILLDTTPISITIVSPSIGTHFVNTTYFNISTSENPNWCGYSLDGNVNVTMNPVNSTYFSNTKNLSEGNHNVTFYCNDSLGNLANVSRTFAIDTEPPAISLESLLTHEYLNYTSNLYFNYTPFSAVGLSTCELWGNWSGGWHLNQSNDAIENLSLNIFTLNLTEGTYTWNIWCNNTGGVSDWSAQGNQTFTIDLNITPPTPPVPPGGGGGSGSGKIVNVSNITENVSVPLVEIPKINFTENISVVNETEQPKIEQTPEESYLFAILLICLVILVSLIILFVLIKKYHKKQFFAIAPKEKILKKRAPLAPSFKERLSQASKRVFGSIIALKEKITANLREKIEDYKKERENKAKLKELAEKRRLIENSKKKILPKVPSEYELEKVKKGLGSLGGGIGQGGKRISQSFGSFISGIGNALTEKREAVEKKIKMKIEAYEKEKRARKELSGGTEKNEIFKKLKQLNEKVDRDKEEMYNLLTRESAESKRMLEVEREEIRKQMIELLTKSIDELDSKDKETKNELYEELQKIKSKFYGEKKEIRNLISNNSEESRKLMENEKEKIKEEFLTGIVKLKNRINGEKKRVIEETEKDNLRELERVRQEKIEETKAREQAEKENKEKLWDGELKRQIDILLIRGESYLESRMIKDAVSAYEEIKKRYEMLKRADEEMHDRIIEFYNKLASAIRGA